MLPDWLKPKGAFTRVEVDVTFLVAAHSRPWPFLPDGISIRRVHNPDITFYRHLYEGVGAEYCWWMRRVMPDDRLAAILSKDTLHVMLLQNEAGESLGFYELDLEDSRDAHLAYFGLLPSALGKGLGGKLLDCAIAHAFSSGAACVRVNTCTQDHPRALPNYLRAGFEITHVEHECWNVPVELLPERLRDSAS
ncbi:GNAT family N-acetyltransferase [Gluconobacter wancherniae]|uniref:N-acetyltransferase domain-containing protein n=1 Tax=Gluconobacter wancherniae NBRC 103581 TaxID=656744 RepID=A0A511B1K1_9PROT|nr:GNAT family N-acetyltransferase [Gluconobacter wancherniae]GEK94288.1 hypothetical protein GWA01_20580 [Gluconobacter wancherniae NBRC 103581]MBF0853890.1 GNAT family N-acetyltransferase [Gluconobacter wancherniae]MBS1062276.1 GNAT family N-acetyltransferase [Gluconobacter wancherniae]MBS1089150.1 GNAT family N-acetyltransferase [Gluconobacter wancherniae]MBS1094318.1 GNAT family N-acetyltransferase [Gluconobacter wancherniae]